MLIPSNTEVFYTKVDLYTLSQGDLIRADGIGLKEPGDECSPDYWMIITKNCDLVFTSNFVTRKQNISIIPLFALRIIHRLYERDFLQFLSHLRKKIVLMAIWKISKIFGELNSRQIESLVQNKISKFMFLPPDGKVFTEPMIIDLSVANFS